MDYLQIFLKASFAFVAGMMFWFLEILAMTAYAFMPGKEMRSAIVLTAAPILYLIIITIIFNKFFKAKGWKEVLLNFVLILVMSAASLGLLSLLGTILA